MRRRTLIVIAAMLGGFLAKDAVAQTASRGQAASPGQSRADNRLPQPPSGGRPTGASVIGAPTDQERAAEARAKKSTQICKGC